MVSLGTLVSFTTVYLCTLAIFGQSIPGSSPADTTTLHVNSRLAFLDVTVLDRKGSPVVTGLTKDDFVITDEKQPQRILSFEPPGAHVAGEASGSTGSAPVTIFVLDQLNSSFEDMAYIRFRVHKYLAAGSDQLAAPAEMLLLGNKSLEMIQGFTRSKADLLDAVDRLPPVLPWKLDPSFAIERMGHSLDALQQIALQNRGVQGRKNIIWVGHGSPGLHTQSLAGISLERLNQYVHDTTNMLVEARMSLFVIYPEPAATTGGIGITEFAARAELGDSDPFAGDINFGVFVNETGGSLFYNRNDIDAQIKRSLQLGANYYTLTYQPPEGAADGRFRRVRVTLRNASLHAMTKTGYFAPNKDQPIDPRQQTMANLDEAVRSTIPFQALQVTVETVVRHPDTGTAEVTVDLSGSNLDWQTESDASGAAVSSSHIGLEAVSLSSRREILAWKAQTFTLTAGVQSAAQLTSRHAHFTVSLRVPPKTRSMRLAIGLLQNGRTGAVEIDRKIIDAAPEAPTPETKLNTRPPG